MTISEKLLHHSVFQGMKADDGDAATRLQNRRNLLEQLSQCAHFVIHFNAQSLEYLCVVPVGVTFHQIGYGFFKSTDRSKTGYLPLSHDGFGQCFCIGYFPVLTEQILQPLFLVGIQDQLSGKRLSFIHAHVQVGVRPSGKSTIGFIKLVTTYAQVREYAIYGVYMMESQEPLEVSEIMRNEKKSLIGQAVLPGLCILIKTIEPSGRIQVSQDLC